MFRSRIVEAVAGASLTVALLLLTACGGGTPPPPSGPANTAAPGGSVAGKTVLDWVDPEPPGAQALAESVVSRPFNGDKTTRLVMHMTTIVDRTSGIHGFATSLKPGASRLEDRLAALGAREIGTEITIRLPGAILFDFDSAAIRPDAQRTLGEVVEVLRAYPGQPIRVEGHTDSIASEAYNQKLSEARAASVAAWLAAHGVERARLQVRGHGESRPVADNGTAPGRQQNRRVEIIIEKGAASPGTTGG